MSFRLRSIASKVLWAEPKYIGFAVWIQFHKHKTHTYTSHTSRIFNENTLSLACSLTFSNCTILIFASLFVLVLHACHWDVHHCTSECVLVEVLPWLIRDYHHYYTDHGSGNWCALVWHEDVCGKQRCSTQTPTSEGDSLIFFLVLIFFKKQCISFFCFFKIIIIIKKAYCSIWHILVHKFSNASFAFFL